MDPKYILIGADIVPTDTNYDKFISGDAKALVGDRLFDILSGAEYRVFNLETPLSDKEAPILKTGPNLKAPSECINGYKAMGIDLLTVANNHTMDQGREAFLDTLATLTENEIDYIGGGASKEEAKRTKIVELCGVKIGFIAFCEHEFSWVDDYGVGALGFDPLESLDDVSSLKSECDFVVALYHGGRENYRYPSPLLQKTCRAIAKHGADLVIAQHTHCIGARENYLGSEIVYGQGNMLFDHPFAQSPVNEGWLTSLLVKLNVDDRGVSIEYIPMEKCGEGVKYSDNPEILENFAKRSAQIAEEGFVKATYTEYVMKNKETFSHYMTHFARAEELGTKSGAGVRNLLTCDPHREFIITYVSELHKLYK